MSQPSLEKLTGRNGKGGLVLALIFGLLIIWIIYTASQSSVVKSNLGSTSRMDQDMNQMSTTQMPNSMPGMNH